jgi:hypothetical protein
MSNDITSMRPSKAFAHLNPNRGLGDGITGGGFPSIGYRGKVLTLRYRGETYHFTRADDGTPSAYIDVIIVNANPEVSKAYYPEWDEDSAGGPVCTANMGVHHGPDPGVPEPQAKSCTVCPRNVWKTLPSGRQGRECQDHKRLAVLLMPSVTARMLGSPLKESVYLKIPPGSLVPLKMYSDLLMHQGLPFAAVITRISFDQKQLFKMQFDAMQTLNDKDAEFVLPTIESPQTLRILGIQSEIREVTPRPGRQQAPESDGLEAFSKGQNIDEQGLEQLKQLAQEQQPAAKRGRPRKSPDVAPAQAAPAQIAPAQEEDLFAPPDGAVSRVPRPSAAPPPKTKTLDGKPWQEASDELDEEVTALLNQKTNDMLK